MRSLLHINDFTKEDIFEIFEIADDISCGKYCDFLKGKTVIMFFPNSSIRTRVTFEKGIHLLGGQTILFAPETLDKKEEIEDVIGYLNHWADVIVVRHQHIALLEKIKKYSKVPIINAMTDINHPCEIISDLYSLSKIRSDFLKDNYLFCGTNSNIGLAWKEASEVMGFSFSQCCPKGHEMEGVVTYDHIEVAVKDKDIICTDSLPNIILKDFREYQITKDIMKQANTNAILNPCPPFFRGEEISCDVVNTDFFVGYHFKKTLLEIQQAIIIYCMAG